MLIKRSLSVIWPWIVPTLRELGSRQRPVVDDEPSIGAVALFESLLALSNGKPVPLRTWHSEPVNILARESRPKVDRAFFMSELHSYSIAGRELCGWSLVAGRKYGRCDDRKRDDDNKRSHDLTRMEPTSQPRHRRAGPKGERVARVHQQDERRLARRRVAAVSSFIILKFYFPWLPAVRSIVWLDACVLTRMAPAQSRTSGHVLRKTFEGHRGR